MNVVICDNCEKERTTKHEYFEIDLPDNRVFRYSIFEKRLDGLEVTGKMDLCQCCAIEILKNVSIAIDKFSKGENDVIYNK